MKSNLQAVLFLGLLVAGILWLVSKSNPPQQNHVEIQFSEFIHAVKNNHVAAVTFKGQGESGDIEGQFKNSYKDGIEFKTYGSFSDHYKTMLQQHNITPNYEKAEEPGLLKHTLIAWLPMIPIILIFVLFMRQLQSGSNKALSFGQSRAKKVGDQQVKVRFSDVAGCEEAKDDLEEIVEFLKSPKKFTRLGGRIPKGVLLIGDPGTGKTLLAKAVAGEASVPFFSISGSDFVEMFVGVGASRVRSLFDNAKKSAPCLVFIDEIDAVGRHRGAGLGGGHDEREQTLNQLLVEMDGFEGTEGVIIIAATNRADVLDPALLRPGRFDRRVAVSKPDVRGRIEIFKVHTKKTPLSKDVDLEVLGKATPGFTGANIENLVNEAALNAARTNRNSLSMADFEFAKDKVLMGAARKSMLVTEDERQHVAYHEAGHALVARLIEGNDPVYKVTIVPRGPAMGFTATLPNEETHNLTRSRAEAILAYMMGGRIAEELKFGHYTTGASNDIERATDLARRMVTEWGMSDKLGPLNYGKSGGNPFLGRDMTTSPSYSEHTMQIIDEEIKSIVDRNYQRARDVLSKNKDKLDVMSEYLLKYETLEMGDVDAIMEGREVVKKLVKSETKDTPDTKDAKVENAEGDEKTAAVDLSKTVKV